MSDYTRLISYVYMYQQNEKGKNTGFVKLESRNGQCKIGISLKGLPSGTADLEVLLFSKSQEVSLGKIYIRNGQGELRIITDQGSLVGSGIPLNQVGGLRIRNSAEPDVYYATVWDDELASAVSDYRNAEVPYRLKASEETKKIALVPDEGEDLREELLKRTAAQPKEIQMPDLSSDEKQQEAVQEESLTGQDCDDCDPCEDCGETSKEDASIAEMEDQQRMADFKESPLGEQNDNIRRPLFSNHWEQGFSSRNGMHRGEKRLQIPDTTGHTLRPFNNQNADSQDSQMSGTIQMQRETTVKEERHLEVMPEEHIIYEETVLEEIMTETDEVGIVIPEPAPEPAVISEAEGDREPECITPGPVNESPWLNMAKQFPKASPFGIDLEHEVLSIQPQDIGMLPRETWIFGNNSFLLHGYYQHRYLVLVKLVEDKEKYFLGVPGIYHNNERFMANMFGFTNFYLAKNQPQGPHRFGFWCAEIKL